MADLPQHVDTPISVIDEAYERLTATFASHKTLSIAYRLYNLKQLAYMLKDNTARIQASLASDLGKSPFDAEFSEIWPALGDIELAVRRLPEWMKDDSRTTDAGPFKLARPRVFKQPKGASLIIGAWNFPWLLCVAPLIGAIAAGCPAIIKGSEHAPASSALLAELIPRYLDPDGYAVVTGGPEQATALLQKRWGHILYTGSGAVGKIVATAAAQTLTSTTLELGGKSPVIVTSDADLKVTARRMLSIKQLNAGQVCVSPDYVLCAKDRVDEFVKEVVATLEEFFPREGERSAIGDGLVFGSAIRNARDYERIEKTLDAADDAGKLVYRGEADAARRKMGISVVRMNRNGEGEDGVLVSDEIFGPVIPIIPVDDVDTAIAYINARPNPLALYVCSSNRKVFLKIIKETISGNAIWNDFALAPVARSLPFGGVGESGWGNYHGYYGFLAFSHQKAIIEVPLWMEAAQKQRYPPNLNEKLMRMFAQPKMPWKRPVSVEHEERRIERSRARRHLYVGVVLVLLGAWAGLGWRKLGGLLFAIKARLGL